MNERPATPELQALRAAPVIDCDGLQLAAENNGVIWLVMVKDGVPVQRVQMDFIDLGNLAAGSSQMYAMLLQSMQPPPPGTTKQ